MFTVDAVAIGGDGKAYLFEGAEYSGLDLVTFKLEDGHPRPIAEGWPSLWERDIDAALGWGTSGQVFFFRGNEYIAYNFNDRRVEDGYPRTIHDNWPGVWDSNIDAAVDWGNGKAYFFRGSEYSRYDIAGDKADAGYPQPIEGNWDGLWSSDIGAAANWGNGKAFFFRSDEYVTYDIAADSVDAGYPKKLVGSWPPSPKSAQALSFGRQQMLELVSKWMPTSLLQPKTPAGESQDLLTKAGWTKARGAQSKADKDAGRPVVTSCGDIVSTMLRLWRSSFVGAFMIRDLDASGKPPGAKGLGYYVEPDGTNTPRPGDIIVLRNGVGSSSTGSVGHVGILIEASSDVWRTADGGGGLLPDQTAVVTNRTVRRDARNIPILKSPTDGKEKQVDGWIDLDRIAQLG